jgi:hypothetical protein
MDLQLMDTNGITQLSLGKTLLYEPYCYKEDLQKNSFWVAPEAGVVEKV